MGAWMIPGTATATNIGTLGALSGAKEELLRYGEEEQDFLHSHRKYSEDQGDN
jgi:hypothetical protein